MKKGSIRENKTHPKNAASHLGRNTLMKKSRFFQKCNWGPLGQSTAVVKAFKVGGWKKICCLANTQFACTAWVCFQDDVIIVKNY